VLNHLLQFAANASDTATTPTTGVGGEAVAKKVDAELKEDRLLHVLERSEHAMDKLKKQNQTKDSLVQLNKTLIL
jgi:hypothetical protein